MLCKYPMNTNYLQGFFCVYCDYNKPCILVILTKKTLLPKQISFNCN